jgi:hypothetical protein
MGSGLAITHVRPRCVVECGAEPDEHAEGWRGYRADLPEEDDEPVLVF